MGVVACWQQALNGVVKGYNLDVIYNCDETGILFRSIPAKSYVENKDTTHGIKRSKERITVLLCCNMSGTDKCKPTVIGKSLRSRCFKNIDPKSLPVDYQGNKKAWMNSARSLSG
ncbi:Tigger transposable element-derived protein 4-like [Oopsacas minuta]|uniref:Tigger transposable element-derived protein 4-like n=1 Tax=Oopsacas minuta TaxID=111878 RepID=A0AAV7JSJ6_9METZ|nr:Tigger transposable element-derived protein 4-like [Oopsacas minuta]